MKKRAVIDEYIRDMNAGKKQANVIAYLDNVYQAPGLAWNQAAAIANYFEENGRRYGLLKDFRENAIC